MQSIEPVFNPFGFIWGFLIHYYFLFPPIICFIVSVAAKRTWYKIIPVILNVSMSFFWMITADRYAGGGGFGDVVAFLLGLILLFLSLIQGIIVWFQLKRMKKR